MVVTTHLVGQVSAALPVQGLSVLSYNVLLPNSIDGWWTYKMYNDPKHLELMEPCAQNTGEGPSPFSVSSWEYRRDLLKERIGSISADVVCLQEVSPESFEQDFDFMQDLGYDEFAMFKRGRFRPATFWKTSECRLVNDPVHKDRSLITAFERQMAEPNEHDEQEDQQPPWYVVNCHLQAGPQGPRRVRQVVDAMKGVMTLARKQKLETKPEDTARVIVCGDFNGGAESGSIRLLEDGYVDETFIEDGAPVTSKRKALPFTTPFKDASASVDSRPPPPTLVVAELISNIVETTESAYQDPKLSQDMIERLGRIYKKFANTADGDMNKEAVERWLICINKKLKRGDEYRNAANAMGWKDPNPDDPWEVRKKRAELPDDGILTLSGFVEVYQKELSGGKFWGIAHDMCVLGEPLPDAGLFTSRFDRIYYNSKSIKPTSVTDTTSDKPCPNDKEASDHLPVAASFAAL